MPQKLLFIINPNSGKGEMRYHLIDCIDRFICTGYEVTVHTTQASGDATQVMVNRGSEYDLIVCSGGDGTLNEAVTGLMQLHEKPALGYIPAGTTNDFATGLGIPRKPLDAVQLIQTGKPHRIDVGKFNERYFTYVAGFGAFTEVSYSTPQNNKNAFGRLAYILEGIKSVATLQHYHMRIECENSVFEDDFIFGMVTNATTVGGFKGIVTGDVGLDDGLFEVFLVRAPASPLEIQIILNELLTAPEDSKFIIRAKTPRVRFISNRETPWTLDGEFGGAPHIAEIANCQKALHIFMQQPV